MHNEHPSLHDEIMAQEIIRQVEVAYSRFVQHTGQEPNTVFLSGFHMTAVIRGQHIEAKNMGTVVTSGPHILGLPVIVADVTPSVGYIVGDNRFHAMPQRRQHANKEIEIERSAKNVAALLRYKEEQEGPK